MTLTLEITGPDLSGRKLELAASFFPLWIGRDPDCGLVLPSKLVSRRHARIERSGDRLMLHDTSANGTFVGQSKLLNASTQFVPGMCVRVGPYLVLLDDHERHAGAPEQHAPARELDSDTRKHIHARVLDHLDLASLDRKAMDAETLRPKVETALASICDEIGGVLTAGLIRDRLIAELLDEVLGLGPLESLLRDPGVSEIMVLDANTIYAESNGRLTRTDLRFTDESSVRAVIERIVTPLGRRIDESTPMVDARLADGSRVNAVIPPLATKGACVTIRKFSSAPIELGQLIDRGSLDARVAKFLTRAVRSRRNIVVAGGTGSGKTTLLNVLSAAIPEHERIVTIEDAAELKLRQSHVVSLEARPANLEGRGEVSIRDLVRNALRMRPDRILVGECRGGEALDMLQAMNTGHDGSMTTTHASSPKETLARLETLCLMADVELPLRAIRAQLAASIHLLVQQARAGDGMRRVTRVTEVVGLDATGEIVLADIFRFDPASGEHLATGYLPSCLDAFAEHGLIDDGVFL